MGEGTSAEVAAMKRRLDGDSRHNSIGSLLRKTSVLKIL